MITLEYRFFILITLIFTSGCASVHESFSIEAGWSSVIDCDLMPEGVYYNKVGDFIWYDAVVVNSMCEHDGVTVRNLPDRAGKNSGYVVLSYEGRWKVEGILELTGACQVLLGDGQELEVDYTVVTGCGVPTPGSVVIKLPK
jgi:hypothetical protein